MSANPFAALDGYESDSGSDCDVIISNPVSTQARTARRAKPVVVACSTGRTGIRHGPLADQRPRKNDRRPQTIVLPPKFRRRGTEPKPDPGYVQQRGDFPHLTSAGKPKLMGAWANGKPASVQIQEPTDPEPEPMEPEQLQPSVIRMMRQREREQAQSNNWADVQMDWADVPSSWDDIDGLGLIPIDDPKPIQAW